jgi:hypothetical protein
MLKNREVFEQDPYEFHLLNNGVAKVREQHSDKELKTLQFELRTFICEGQYEEGLIRLLRSFVTNLNKPEQPAAWISGFFGSGKSHLVKMLRYLWVDYEFPDGTTARGLASLSTEVEEQLRELDTAAARYGGLHAAAGTLGAAKAGSIRLALLSIIFKSVGLHEKYPLAQFELWLKQEGLYEGVRQRVEAGGKDWSQELNSLTKSTIAKHLHDLRPSLGNNVADVRKLLRTEHSPVDDVSLDDMVQAIQDALSSDEGFPLTLLVLDEVQQYIHEEASRSIQVQEITQACCSELGSKLLFVATGQNALTGDHYLSKLSGRYSVKVQLSDADVEKVTRKTVLQKKSSARPKLQTLLERHSGEISRHLQGTDFAPRPEDDRVIVDDYPLLPTRRRFWERVLRAVDEAGTQSQVRSQLTTVDQAVKRSADDPIGTVVPADFLYRDKRADLLESGQLTHEIDTTIEKMREHDPFGGRLCALAFLIGKLPRERGGDTGLRATAETFADLMVADLKGGSEQLRRTVAEKLEALESEGVLMQVDGEYRLQTRESQEWLDEFRRALQQVKSDRTKLAHLRTEALRGTTEEHLKDLKVIKQGDSNEGRPTALYFGQDKPNPSTGEVPIWVRQGWRDTETSVEADAKEAGHEDETIFVFLPKRSADVLDEALANAQAAEATLDVRGQTTTPEGIEARRAMQTRLEQARQRREDALDDVMDDARVYLAGGQQYEGKTPGTAIRQAAGSALERLFPKFDVADDSRWSRVLRQALDGDATALKVLEYKGKVHEHPVCAEVLKQLHATKKGSEVRKQFTTPPYGWPQDAVDASLALLTLTDHVRARTNGQPVAATDLTQRTIGSASFRAETVTVTQKQRLQVRGLLSSVGIKATGDEAEKAPAFLERAQAIATEASGEPPLPPKPDIGYIHELQRHRGNELIAGIHAKLERFNQDLNAWQSRSNRKSGRLASWNTLKQAVSQAEGLEGVKAIRKEMEAIREQHSLLEPNDPTHQLLRRVTDLLRDALQQAHAEFEQAHEAVLEQLRESDTWQQLQEADQSAILARHRLDHVPSIDVGTTEELLQSLNAVSLDEWRTRQDALAHRFQKALAEAARLLEPEVVAVKLDSRVLKTQEEVEQWIKSTREMLLRKVKEQPVQV